MKSVGLHTHKSSTVRDYVNKILLFLHFSLQVFINEVLCHHRTVQRKFFSLLPVSNGNFTFFLNIPGFSRVYFFSYTLRFSRKVRLRTVPFAHIHNIVAYLPGSGDVVNV